MTNKPEILLIYTGGTIGMVKDYESNALKAFNFANLFKKIPELKQLNCNVESVSFDEPIDSSNMNTFYWIQILEIIENHYNKKDGFVVLTGSDTMSYTSSAISFMIENLTKPIIFTGSQLPIGDLRTDAKENLITAIQIASAKNNKNEPIVTEVGLYFEYKLYRANRTTKINAEQFEAFASANYPAIAESGVHLKFEKHLLLKPDKNKKTLFRKNLDTNIVILKLFPGITKEVIEAILKIPKLKGVVLEAYGSGNAPNDKWFLSLLKNAIDKGIHIIDVSQCVGGSVILGQYDTSVQLKKLNLINGKDITTESAIAKLMYLLGENVASNSFKDIFETPLRGEMS
ncbi:asparaginase [Aureibaculum sp. 2210JD6-5]|uniref:asparaginase n=1 Tax=Aureibaculum sp. 2210JD6-5 TaxID=3103957 RepID=UPI002AADB858|nr:asparaginase [Aureibaculum sp. 2210JD6-5]MDY7396011.1 asparaginase [Aureibaculum sp. 2210JD6-5]